MLLNPTRPLIGAQPAASASHHPEWISPCLATEVFQPPTGARWVHEVKRDGYRTQLHKRGANAKLYSRAGYDWTDRYDLIAKALLKLPARHVVIDAEMTVPYANCHRDDFWTLQADVARRRDDRLVAWCFDLLFLDGRDVRGLPLIQRKALLRDLVDVAPSERLRWSEHLEADGPALLTQVRELGLEGMVSKVADAPYQSERSSAWLKTICQYPETLPVLAIKIDKGAFAGIYVAREENGTLVYAGKVEHGFTEEAAGELLAEAERRGIKRCVLDSPPDKPKARWIGPGLTAHVVHRGGLQIGPVRHAVFKGIAEDTKARPRVAVAAPRLSVARENILQLLPDATVPTIDQLKAHWRKVGPKALAHLGNRPLKFVRHFAGTTYYHMGQLPPVPSSVRQLKIRKADGTPGTRLWVDSIDGLLGLADMGIIELHPWAATVEDIEKPDTMIFDLDPGEGVEWPLVRDTALGLRDMLKTEGFTAWPKLTGGKGIHLMVPIEPQLSHRVVHGYAKALADRLANTNRRRYTIVAGERHRVGRIFIDYLRNGRGCTAIGAFSPRARAGFPIAAPTTWDAVRAGKRPDSSTMRGPPSRAQ